MTNTLPSQSPDTPDRSHWTSPGAADWFNLPSVKQTARCKRNERRNAQAQSDDKRRNRHIGFDQLIG